MSGLEDSATIREFRDADRSSVLALVDQEISRSRYAATLRGAVEAVFAHDDPDSRALVTFRAGKLVGIIIFGTVAGAEGAGRLQLIVTDPGSRRTGIASALVEAAVEELRRSAARFVVVELPDDPELAPAAALLEHRGFVVDARVRDFHRDGMDLVVFRRPMTGG